MNYAHWKIGYRILLGQIFLASNASTIDGVLMFIARKSGTAF